MNGWRWVLFGCGVCVFVGYVRWLCFQRVFAFPSPLVFLNVHPSIPFVFSQPYLAMAASLMTVIPVLATGIACRV